MTESGTLDALVRMALDEDVGSGDWTTHWTVEEHAQARARVVAKSAGVIAGMQPFRTVFRMLEGRVHVDAARDDGDVVHAGAVVCSLRGPARAILTGERTALNFLQRLSGVASLTRRYVDAVRGTDARILDTRKTTPALRQLEKAAVRAGGGHNHRVGLFDMVLIKENHAAAAGGIAAAVERVRRENAAGLRVEVEVRTLDELDQALAAGVDRVMLDNMDLDTMRAAVRRARTTSPVPEIEASGNMTLERVPDVAATGVDFISVGALTHSAPALDLSLLVET